MELNYTLTRDDYIAFNLHHANNDSASKKRINFLRILLPVAAAFMMVLTLLTNHSGVVTTIISIVPALAIGIVWIIFLPRFYNFLLVKNIKKMLEKREKSEFEGPVHLVLGQDTLHLQKETGTSETKYIAVERIEEDSQHLYIYIGAISAIIVPFVAFASQQEKNLFLQQLSSKANVQQNI